MTVGPAIEFNFKFPEWEKLFKRNLNRVYLLIAATMQSNRGFLFDAEGAYNGRPKWAPLKFRNGMILQDKGSLRRSMAPPMSKGRPGPDGIVRWTADTVTIGTNLAYARMMNDGTTKLPGGVLRPRKAKALMIPIPAGKHATAEAKGMDTSRVRIGTTPSGKPKMQNVIFRKSVKIPARPFDTWNEQDAAELADVLQDYLYRMFTSGRAD